MIASSMMPPTIRVQDINTSKSCSSLIAVAVALTTAEPVGHVDMRAHEVSGGELVWQRPTHWTSWRRPDHRDAVMLRDPRTEREKIRPIDYDPLDRPGDGKRLIEWIRDMLDKKHLMDWAPLTEPLTGGGPPTRLRASDELRGLSPLPPGFIQVRRSAL